MDEERGQLLRIAYSLSLSRAHNSNSNSFFYVEYHLDDCMYNDVESNSL